MADHGKTVVGWHEIAPAAHLDGRVLQFWDTTGVDPDHRRGRRRGARLIVSPGNHAYLDMKYAPDTPMGHDWAGLIDVRKAYDWDPGTHVAGVPAEAVLGVEAPLWTESVISLADIESLLLPRLPAIAELGWSPREKPRLGRLPRPPGRPGPALDDGRDHLPPRARDPWPTTADVPTQPSTPQTDTAKP